MRFKRMITSISIVCFCASS